MYESSFVSSTHLKIAANRVRIEIVRGVLFGRGNQIFATAAVNIFAWDTLYLFIFSSEPYKTQFRSRSSVVASTDNTAASMM